MENVADALKMAGSVLLFVIALSACMLAFSQAREATDTILAYSDRESLSIENDERFYYLSNENETKRYVGLETIIPSIYRAYSESYKIVFEFNDSNYYLFKQNDEIVNSIDLENLSKLGNKEEFLKGIIYGEYPGGLIANFKNDFISQKIEPHNTCLKAYTIERLKNGTLIEEKLGVYRLSDLGEGTQENYSTDQAEKRVITYCFTTK